MLSAALEVQSGVAPMDPTTVGAVLLIITIITTGAVVLPPLIIGDLIDMEEAGTTGIAVTAVASTIVVVTDLHTAIAEEGDTSVTEAPSTTVAEMIITETVSERETGTETGGTGTGTAALMATMVAVEAAAATALGVGPDLVRPVIAAAPTAANASTVETRIAMLLGASLAGDLVAAVLLRLVHLRFLSQDSHSTALRGVRHLGAPPHLRGSNLWERESLLLPRPQ